jgi:hypothetical protein
MMMMMVMMNEEIFWRPDHVYKYSKLKSELREQKA